MMRRQFRIAPMLGLALFASACGRAPISFDKAGWAAERGNYDRKSSRGAMVGGLDEAGIVIGAPRERVRALLGEPDSTGPQADIYFLGRSATGPGFETYRIDYEPGNRVRAASVRRS
ncbi:hypothetical protein [Allosphingosinicella deserti]|uniref:Lipoprotein SmpA/OmlA domain-containing protein n=1 Tax=Allosphingosinicella deserti TaxID=2116704 RepID=A0A2P7QI61_9SPHN|nr:hypothetical protein [Sphingomonas deserti]PSJ37649.1 hypothetical protein C7I55_21525 [Sphingomonas deserti]